MDGITSLIDKSLLQQREQESEEPRLVILETIREYGLEVLSASGEMEVIRQAHANYYLRFAEEAEREVGGPQQVMWLERLEQEHGNLRAALSWLIEQGEARQSMEMALRFGGALRRFWLVRGHYSEGRSFLERALGKSEGVAALVRAKALFVTANLAQYQGDDKRAETLAQESLALHSEIGDTRGIAHSLGLLSSIAANRGNFTEARSLTEKSAMLFRELGNKEDIAYSLFNLALLFSMQGEYAEARALFEESMAMHKELENKKGLAASLFRLAETLFVSQGDQATVHSLLEESLMLDGELGSKEGRVLCLLLLGEVALNQGDGLKARTLAQESLALCKEMGDRPNTAHSLALLGKVKAYQGDNVAARTLFQESLAIAKMVNDKWEIASSLEGLASVAAAQRELLWAARLWGAAESLRKAMGTPIPPVHRADYESSVAAARAQVGEKAFAKALAEGRTMSQEQALATQGQVPLPTLISVEPSSSPTIAPPPAYPAGLTAREMEVLRLLAQGLTSAQIAEQLVIGLVTVNSHVRSIYSKLGLTSRAAATRYAIEHKLL